MTDSTGVPFDTQRLDELMEAAGLDLLVVTSKPAVQYLLGGYRFFFFEHADAIGQSRYLPVFIYPKGRPERAAYIGHRMEKGQQQVEPLWVPQVRNLSGGSKDAMQLAVDYIREASLPTAGVGAELAFLPDDAGAVLRDAFAGNRVWDALPVLERLRARKTEAEIGKLRRASEAVIDSMLAVMASHGPRTTKRRLVEALRREEVGRGLTFDYCLITAGTSLNRAPSDQVWDAGDILSLDSGGNYDGYIGDVCRMGILGEPDAELTDLLGVVDDVQQAAFSAVREGALGGEIYERALRRIGQAAERESIEFLAHGMGLVTHEVPHLTNQGPVPYPAEDVDRPLDAGMVISVETTLQHPQRGFIKLEDTVLVRPDGYEILGTAGRGWNRGGVGGQPAA